MADLLKKLIEGDKKAKRGKFMLTTPKERQEIYKEFPELLHGIEGTGKRCEGCGIRIVLHIFKREGKVLLLCRDCLKRAKTQYKYYGFD